MAWSLCLSCGSPLRFGDACPACGTTSGADAEGAVMAVVSVAAQVRPAPLAHREPIEMPAARPSQVVVPEPAPHPPPLVEPIPEDIVALPVFEVVELAEGMPLQVWDHEEAGPSDDLLVGSDEVEEVTGYAYEGQPFVEEGLEEEEPEQLKLVEDEELPPEAPVDEELSPEVARPPTVLLAVEEVDDAFDDWLR